MLRHGELAALRRYRLSRREWVLFAVVMLLGAPFAGVVWTQGYSTPPWVFAIAPALMLVYVAVAAVLFRSIVRNAQAGSGVAR